MLFLVIFGGSSKWGQHATVGSVYSFFQTDYDLIYTAQVILLNASTTIYVIHTHSHQYVHKTWSRLNFIQGANTLAGRTIECLMNYYLTKEYIIS